MAPLRLYHVHGRSICQSSSVAYSIMSLASNSSQWDLCPHHWAWGATETCLNIRRRHLMIQWFEFISSIIMCSYTYTLWHHPVVIQMKTSSSGKTIDHLNKSTNQQTGHQNTKLQNIYLTMKKKPNALNVVHDNRFYILRKGFIYLFVSVGFWKWSSIWWPASSQFAL